MSENKKKQGESPAPITLGLRLAGGGYLIWLAFQLVPELLISSGFRNLIQLVFMILFFLTGAIMVIWSLKRLLFKDPNQQDSRTEDEQEHIV
ncbi:MAG: hypothetical protein K0R23_919 [Lacrimispora sp.]|jgi:uncharacterized SAM-binding protein YcdF (DUF218 family)|nr:hypothetical protein [Lacrimispora sp.]